MKVLVPAGPLRAELGTLPAGVELVAEPVPGVEVVVLDLGLMDDVPALLGGLESLRVVLSVFAGVDGFIDSVPAGVTVCGASGAHDIAVAEWVVTVLLAQRRRLPELLERQRRGEWSRADVRESPATRPSAFGPLDDLHGATVLVLGYGSIGRAVAARLAPFGANLIGIASRARADAHGPEALAQLLGDADAVVLLLPLTPATDRIVDAAFLAAMKPGAVLVNAARGRLVDTDALLAALHSGRLRAALDVTDPEPLPATHPLWQAPNVLVTPHVAGEVRHWQARAYRIAGEQIRRYAAGEPLLNVYSRP